jgi:hypothetical protein
MQRKRVHGAPAALARLANLRLSRRQLLVLSAGASLCAAGCSGGTSSSTPTRLPAPTPDETQVASSAIVRQIDHILLKTDDAPALFKLLTETLGIPVAWPIFTYRGFQSGAAGFGNVNLEVLQHAEGEPPPFATAPGTYPIGIAFEPVTIDGALRELDSRGIGHSEPFEDGVSDAIRWTSIDLDGTPQSSIRLLVKYSFDQDARRGQLGSQLRDRRGGLLGVTHLDSIELEAAEIDEAVADWQHLFEPLEPTEPGLWRLGAGPALRITAGPQDRFRRAIVGVRSLGEAVHAMRERALLGASSARWAELAPADGAIRFVESAG